MIPEIDEAILGSLRKGLAGLVPEDRIAYGPADGPASGVRVASAGFTIEESGMAASDVRNEEREQRFDADGQALEFALSGTPVKEVLQVECPKGTFRAAPDDFTFDRVKGAVIFRDPPKKGKESVRIRYELDKPLGESRLIKFALLYTISIGLKDARERDKATLAAIEALYRDVGSLFLQGVDDIRFDRGYSVDAADGKGAVSVLEYTVRATRRIDIVYPPMEKIEIKKV